MKQTMNFKIMKYLSMIYGILVFMFWTSTAGAKINVVATLQDIGAVAAQIGGDRINLKVIAGANEDPHFVDAKPGYIRLLNQADILIENGGEIEAGWLPPLINSARNKKILINSDNRIMAIKGVKLLDVPVGRVDRSQGDIHPSGNPHYMLDPENWIIVASNIAKSFIEVDQPGSECFRNNLKIFVDKVDSKIQEWKKMMKPYAGTKIITYHKSFDYLINYFGMELYDTIEPKPGIEPSPFHIANLIKRAKQDGVKLVIIEPNKPKKTAIEICNSIGAKMLILPIMPGGGESPNDIIGWYDYLVLKLVEALKN